MISLAIFTLEDGQVVSDKQIVRCANETNKSFDEQIVAICGANYPAHFCSKNKEGMKNENRLIFVSLKDDFSQTICPSRRKRRRQYDINSQSDGQMPDDLSVL